jgi:uncharacterized protein YcfL
MKRVAIFLCFLVFISCKKDSPSTPQLSSTTVLVDKSNNSATLTAKVISESGSATKERASVGELLQILLFLPLY